MPNKSEIGNSSNPTKSNVMNYGITLLKCFFGNKLKIKIDNISFDLPKNKTMSKEFCDFISKCLYRNISKRESWNTLYNHAFVSKATGSGVFFNNKDKDNGILIDNEILKIILDSVDTKFKLINEYYGNYEFNEKTEYIKEIEIFLLLTLFEQLMILKFFNKKEGEPFTSQQEISFITINKDCSSSRCNINFANPIFNNMKLIELSNNKLISDFLIKLKNYIDHLKKITYKIHETTKSDLTKGNYQSFLEKFITVLESSNFHNYFFSIIKNIHKLNEEKSYEKAYKEIPIAEYICECILFVKASLFERNDEKIYFDQKELIKQFDSIFEDDQKENNIEISISLSKEKSKYILISFLGVLFRYFKTSLDINQLSLQQNKAALDGLFTFYPSLMKLLVDSKKRVKTK